MCSRRNAPRGFGARASSQYRVVNFAENICSGQSRLLLRREEKPRGKMDGLGVATIGHSIILLGAGCDQIYFLVGVSGDPVIITAGDDHFFSVITVGEERPMRGA